MTSDDLIAAQNAIPFPSVPVPVQIRPQISAWARFFSWLTGFALASGIVVALISATMQRNDLQDELFCRSAASIVTTKAVNIRDNLIAKALVDVAKNDLPGLQSLVPQINTAIDNVNTAIDAQALALVNCGKH